MSFSLLIDECLHPGLVAIAKERGILADFGPHIGKSGWQDHNLVRFAIDNDYVIVSNNRRDFLKLYMQLELHGGLIILVPRAHRATLDELFVRALDRLALSNSDIMNQLVEVLLDGTVHVRDWNAVHHDLLHIDRPEWLG